MSDKAAILCTFADWRTVKSRKVLQLIMEIPLEQQGEALRVLGPPNPVDPQWVGLAPLNMAAVQAQGAQAPVPTQEKERRAFHELPLSQQAALACTNKAFQRFMREECGYVGCNDEHACADAVRIFCDVGSRADLKPDNAGGKSWIGLNAKFNAWMRSAL